MFVVVWIVVLALAEEGSRYYKSAGISTVISGGLLAGCVSRLAGT